MIDIHAHIIPGVDDGPYSIEDSLKILRMSQEDGVDTIVATSHLNPDKFFRKGDVKGNLDRINNNFDLLCKRSGRESLDIEILRGAEIYFDYNLREYLENFRDILTLNNSDYFLMEFPAGFVYPGIKNFVFDIMTAGFIPVIAHPERNSVFQNDMGLLYQLVNGGAVCQVNAGSLTGRFGSDAESCVMKMFKHKLVHAVASDCHDTESRNPELSHVCAILRNMGLEPDVFVHKVPEALLLNRALPDTGQPSDPSVNRVMLFLEGLVKNVR